jgi:hypothetical protein
MEFQILMTNLTNPTLLFFVLGAFAALVKSDLEIPPHTIKFISLYLLFSIGFRGGQELAHSGFTSEVVLALFFGVVLATVIPIFLFFALKRRFSVADAGAIAATYGSVSAVTFVAASSFLEFQGLHAGGHMVAVMAAMEAPAIIVGVLLISWYDRSTPVSFKAVLHHSLTNGSILMVVGSLVIGLIADAKQAEGIRPFASDIFKGFLAIFLLEMGMVTVSRIRSFLRYGPVASIISTVVPLLNGSVVAYASQWVTPDPANRFMFSILAASGSYIAVPATLRLAVPKADPGLYIPMALGITFPVNLTIGMPLYFWIVHHF